MKKFPYLRTSLSLALVSLATSVCRADEITLKDGTRYDGPVVSEDADSITLRVSRGKGITKLEKISKANIVKHEKTTPDKIEAEELRKLIPAPDGMSDAAYQQKLTEEIIPFLNRYPKSPFRAEIEKIRDTYLDEKARAQKGEKKVEGEWVTPEEQNWNAYNFAARLKRVEMDRKLKEGNLQEAYRIYSELEKERPASVEYVKALQSIIAAIPEFEKQITQAVKEQPILKQRREEYVKSLTPENKRVFDAGVKSAADKLKLEIEDAKRIRAGGGLLPFDPYDDKSIDAAQKALNKEQQRLGKIDVEALKNGTEAFQKGLKDVYDKRYESAVRNFKTATSVASIQSDPSGFVRQQVELANKAAQEAARATREAGGGITPAFTGSTATPSAAPKPAVREPAKTEAGAPVRTASNEDPVVDEEYPEEPESNVPIYLMLGAGVVLVAGLIAKVLAKKKAGGAAE